MSDEGELRATSPGDHWDRVWDRSDPDRVSWFEPRSEMSLALIESSGVGCGAALIDVGAGASMLTGQLLEAGYEDLTVLDISAGGIAAGQSRLGPRAAEVQWITADVRQFEPPRTWDLWHDRAVFHFLIRAADRTAYREALDRALAPDGQAILATFGPEGPTSCSGLEVRRYAAESLAAGLGASFRLEETRLQEHTTPAGGTQQFLYARFSRVG